MFKIDNVEYSDVGVLSLTRNFEIRQREDNGFSTVTGTRINNNIGRFISYDVVFDMKKYNQEQRTLLYETLTDPDVDYHSFVLPYNGDTYAFDGYVLSGSDPLDRIRGGVNYWGALTVQICAYRRKV